jgi:23S rRNA pseudouridine1911/1915/1917 synthase
VIKRFLQSNITHVEATLETGRTHQIRVHFAHLGHPVLGDPLYGGTRRDIKTNGQTLHASHLEFYHPILKNDIIIESPLPEHFRDIMEKLK